MVALLKPVYFGNHTRFVVLFLALLCHTFLKSNTLALNFTIICMSGNSNQGLYKDEVASPQSILGHAYEYSKDERAWLFSVIAVGSLIGSVATIVLLKFFKMRAIFTLFGLLSVISTALTPVAAYYGFYWLMLMRFLEGLATAVTYPAMGSFTSHWSTLKQAGLFVVIQNACVQLGPLFTMPVSGFLCESSLGWQSVFYVHAVGTLVSFGVFWIFYRDSPYEHRCVSNVELKEIQKDRHINDRVRYRVPYRRIITSFPIIGVWISYVAIAAGYNLFTQYGPIYLNKVLGYNVSETGLAGAVPFLIAIVSKLLAGPISDYATCFSQRARILFLASTSQAQLVVCFLLMAFLPKSAAVGVLLSYCVAINANALAATGTLKSGQLVAAQHSPFVMAVINMIHAVVILVLPHVVSALAPDNTYAQWSTVFLVCGSIIATCQFLFIFLARGEPAVWTQETKMSVHPIDGLNLNLMRSSNSSASNDGP
uniref:MFS domain-containing protein n=1 Tax=Steinernema glaseri TaxID=37863 RepID=A0A1I7YSW2_9BILA